ncbi:MAG TPA: tripartite tricarboxylate transporter substrate binding protein [Falsiroseomonas sp.]|jgi:tripartite-type tricarboxylate transporter receptor subunit TctC|nr:tripartite tricarboxylate transporter substrate binding protein [Falsiroseomonas sp.]
MKKRTLLTGGLAVLAATPALGQGTWPERVVRIVAPFAPGGIVDAYARMLATHLSERWSQPVVVENRPGAAGYVGTEQAARAPADGYTIVMGSITTHALTPFLFRNPTYQPSRDFVPIALVMEAEGVAAVHPSLPVRTIPELIAHLRAANPPPTIATGGIGSASHLAAEMFKRMAGLERLEVNHYRSMAPMVTDMIAGHATIGFPTMQTAVPHVRSGALRGLAVIGAERSTALPDLPTVAASGLPGFAVSNWFGLFAPTGTPPAIVQRVNAEVMRIMARPEIQRRLPADGARFWENTPEEFATFVAAQARTWGPIAQAAGISLN